MSNQKVLTGVGVALLLVLGGLLFTASVNRGPSPEALARGEATDCGPGLSAQDLDTSIELGQSFLLNNQLPAGNFAYEYDWQEKMDSPGDNDVRQAGATWGLALLYQDHPSPQVQEALLKALAFWEKNSTLDTESARPRRWVSYKGKGSGGTGTVALLALAHIDFLRANPPLDEATRAKLDQHAQEYLDFVVTAHREHAGFKDKYFTKQGVFFGSRSPYVDGEVLLAMVKAARYAGREDLWQFITPWAQEDHDQNVIIARRVDPDSAITKGYYQWASMSWFEMIEAEAEGSEDYAEWLMELAEWMIDTHHTLKRRKNTAYAYEGIVSAYEIARRRQDPREAKFACVIDQGMRKLTTWQVGHPLAIDFVKYADPTDDRARGGIQNAANEAPLRIDVTQHQMHAAMLTRRYVRP